jgi:hypothetical protein
MASGMEFQRNPTTSQPLQALMEFPCIALNSYVLNSVKRISVVRERNPTFYEFLMEV